MNDQELIKKERKATAPDLYQNYARAERIEEYKGIIDEEIDHLRDMRENELDADRWLKLDNDIDALLIQKENAAAEIDAARLQTERRIAFDDSDLGTNFTISGGEVLEVPLGSEHSIYDKDGNLPF